MASIDYLADSAGTSVRDDGVLNLGAFSRDPSAMVHELTHVLIRQIGASARIPNWLNEGTAELVLNSYPGQDAHRRWQIAQAVRMAATGALPDLDDMGRVNPTSVEGFYAFSYAAAVLLRQDLGTDGFAKVLTGMGSGVAFSTAYAAQTGQPFTAFKATFAQRVALLK